MIAEAAVAIAFTFSRTDGNIRPFHARIAANGDVTVDGARTGHVGSARLAALRRIAAYTSFAGLPAHIACPGVLPDVATRNVTMTSGRKSWSVTTRGGCNARFERMYRALAGAAAIK